MSSVAAIILAAGASTRLGEPKQLVVLEDETLLERAVRIASTVCDPVVVVLGSNADMIRGGCDLGQAIVTVNENWVEGMGSSIRAGMIAVGNSDGVVLMTCDMPFVTTEHLALLTRSGTVTASAHSGGRGVPAFFPASSFPELLRQIERGGAKDLLKSSPTVELALGELDVDTIDDLRRVRTIAASIRTTIAV